MKRFHDAEATVIGVTEMERNGNAAMRNAVGRTARSSSKSGKKAVGALGTLQCRLDNGVEFDVGTGWTEAQRQDLWLDRRSVVGRMLKFKYQMVSPDGIPRFPVFLGWRDE